MKILPNGIAVLEGDTHISKWVEESGRLDHDNYAVPQFCALIKAGGVVLDCGAFIGDHTVAYARKAAKVIAIEANPDAYKCLEHNIRALHNVLPMNCAVSNKPGFVHLKKDPNAGATFTESAENGIACVLIDDLSLEALDFVKMDIEGFELKALEGADRTLRRFRPIVALEINRGALQRNGASFQAIQHFMLDHLQYQRMQTLPPLPADRPYDLEPQFDAIYFPY
jgi:FkbM family methyltransferase